MHGWITSFSRVFPRITVVGLSVGEYDLPENVQVYSLGKEWGVGRVGYILNFYRTLWLLRGEYDAVFVHMNTEYVLLGGLLWFLARKPLYLWYNHRDARLLSRFAFLLPKKLLHTSPFAATAGTRKSVRMPVGVDTESFCRLPDVVPNPHSILFLGRISPIKKLHILLDALTFLDKKGVEFSLHVYGNTLSRDESYVSDLQVRAAHEFGDQVVFHGPVKHEDAPRVFNAHAVYVNLTPAGSFDKTILEAMACETVTIVSNESLRGEVPDMFIVRQDDPTDLARVLGGVLTGADEYRGAGKELRAYALKNHALSALTEKLKNVVSAL